MKNYKVSIIGLGCRSQNIYYALKHYFDFCYGDASEAMMKYFTACRTWTHHLTANNLISGRVLNVRIEAGQYPK